MSDTPHAMGTRKTRALCGMLAVLAGTIGASALSAAVRGDAFAEAPCLFTVPASIVEGRDLVCGSVAAPESHAAPGGPALRIPVAIFATPSRRPRPDPLVLLAGGPGESTFEVYVEAMGSPIAEIFRAERDVVLIELPGLFHAEPTLLCPEIHSALIQSLGRDLGHAESLALQMNAIRSCKDQLAAQGIDRSAYNNVESAADIALVMTALGYEQFNLYGNSAGSKLAQHVMRDYPERLRSVIVGSVLPITRDFAPGMPADAADALGLVFQRCEADPVCHRENPALETTLRELMEAFERQPVPLRLTNPFTHAEFDLLLTGERLAQWIFALLYDTDAVARLPRLISRLAAGDYAPLVTYSGAFVVPARFSWGIHLSVQCAEGAGFSPDDIALGSRYPEFAAAVADLWYGPRRLLAACEIWDVEPLGDEFRAPVSSEVPTLLLSGALDNVAPPRYAALMAKTLTHAYSYTYPGVAHTPISGGICPLSMLAQFLGDPTRAPDDRCIAGMADEASLPWVRLVIPAGRTVLPDPFARQLTLLLASTLLLLSAVLVWPLSGWRARRRSRDLWLARWLAATAAGLDLLFLVVFLASYPMLLLLVVLIPGHPLQLLAGYPLLLRVALWLPLVSVVPALAALIYGAGAWRGASWGMAGRAYFALVIVAVLVFVRETSANLL